MRNLIALTCCLLLAAAGCTEDSNGYSANNGTNNGANNGENNGANNGANNGEDNLIGMSCSSNADCGFGGFCVMDDGQNGFVGGYCITSCDPQDLVPCPGDNPCLLLGENFLCVDACDSHEDCREGYVCNDWATEGVCFPGQCRDNGDCGEGQICNRGVCGSEDARIGDPCEEHGECPPGGFCIMEVNEQGDESGWSDGYCSYIGCETDDDCVGDGVCVDNGEGRFCLDACTQEADCRDLYRCGDFAGDDVCLPAECDTSDDCPAGECIDGLCGDPEAAVGDACGEEDACAPGDVCVTPETNENTVGYHDGYCLRFNCNPNMSGDCGEGANCIPVDQEGNGICWAACEENADCREGGLYECRKLYPQVPDGQETCLPLACDDFTECPDGYACNNDGACIVAD